MEKVEMVDKNTPQEIYQTLSFITNMVTRFLCIGIDLMKNLNLLQLSIKLKDLKLITQVMLGAQIIKTQLHLKHKHILHNMNNLKYLTKNLFEKNYEFSIPFLIRKH